MMKGKKIWIGWVLAILILVVGGIMTVRALSIEEAEAQKQETKRMMEQTTENLEKLGIPAKDVASAGPDSILLKDGTKWNKLGTTDVWEHQEDFYDKEKEEKPQKKIYVNVETGKTTIIESQYDKDGNLRRTLEYGYDEDKKFRSKVSIGDTQFEYYEKGEYTYTDDKGKSRTIPLGEVTESNNKFYKYTPEGKIYIFDTEKNEFKLVDEKQLGKDEYKELKEGVTQTIRARQQAEYEQKIKGKGYFRLAGEAFISKKGFLGAVEGARAGRTLSDWMKLADHNKWVKSWQEKADEIFSELYLGLDYWVEDICKSKAKTEGASIAFTTSEGLATTAAHIEGERSEKIEVPEEDDYYYYKITYYVNAADEDIRFNVNYGGKKMYTNDIIVPKGTEFGKLGINTVVWNSTDLYSKVCLAFDKEYFPGYGKNLCNNIGVMPGMEEIHPEWAHPGGAEPSDDDENRQNQEENLE